MRKEKIIIALAIILVVAVLLDRWVKRGIPMRFISVVGVFEINNPVRLLS